MRIVLIVVVLALVLYSLLDCARTPEEDMPARIPKFVWIMLIVLFPTIGAIAWIITSRVKAAEERGGTVEPTVWSSREGTAFKRPERPRPVAPDDDPEFLRGLERDIRRRRADRPDNGTTPGSPGQDGENEGPDGEGPEEPGTDPDGTTGGPGAPGH
ncbi:MAG: PLD nuclease N-terminal domain-containing protein [Actinomyces sp.]|uniref:PLD nuclease N-terminal domain-containing protein n=1 Tax=Actinomyces sp. TaxID=29317 RepID=UPI0026DD686E|nr:PLD nuclease N-terminal domain-containing protein [Actinomyces sp.]MDO4242157.1 PLD nuclease N-terminal domain-containing protein [Actinomyces sp.]